MTTKETPVRMTRLRAHLAGLGPQYEIAAACHLHPYTLSQYTTGQKEIATHHLLALSDYLNVAPEELVGFMDFDR